MSFHIRSGVVVFATSNRPDEALTTFLLRRGVIGLRDKDEIERRLLSHRRAGTILREMGILTQDELVRFVREQLREIILSVFSWERGEWKFLTGEPPSVEEVALDRPVEEIVLQGMRSVRDWSRIRAGCGDLDTVLRKVATPPSSTSAFEMGPDEGEVLAAVSEPCSVSEICKATAIPDHRAAQVLWGFQILGILEREARKTVDVAAKKSMAAAAKDSMVTVAEKAPTPVLAAREPATALVAKESGAGPAAKEPVPAFAAKAEMTAPTLAAASEPAAPAAALAGSAVAGDRIGSSDRASSG